MSDDQRVDRAAWARIVQQMLDSETKGKKEPLARLIGVSAKTIDRWLAQEVDVAEATIRRIAPLTGRKAMDLLVEVGYYKREQLKRPSRPRAVDPALKQIEESDLPEHLKARMRERLDMIRVQRQQWEVDEVAWWINQSKGA